MKTVVAKDAIMLSAGMALSGTAGVFSLLSAQPTFNVVFFRCFFGAICLAAWGLRHGSLRPFRSITRTQLPLILVSGLALVLNWLALFEAFNRTTIGFATIIYHLAPFWIVIAGSLFLKEALSRDKLGWIGVGFLGLVLTVLPKLGVLQSDRDWLIGIALAIIASLLYATTTLTTRAVKGVAPEVLSSLHCLIGVAAFLFFLNGAALGTGGDSKWLWLVGLGLIHTGIVYVLLYSSYPKLPTMVIAAGAFLNPAAALLCDYFIFGRNITLLQGLGLALILTAGLAVNMGWRLIPGGRR